MLYVRGSPADYDTWAEMGADGWSFNDVLPYFHKSEDSQFGMESKYHSRCGPLTVSYPSYSTVAAKAFVEAGRKLGYRVGDYNGGSPFGFSIAQMTIRNGKRCSTATAFLHPAMERSSLHIGTGVTVRRVIFEGNKAVGVSYVQEPINIEGSVRARREVILSAGAIGSPHILMLSGIGPSAHLKETDIEAKIDHTVGKYLYDHVVVHLSFITSPESDYHFSTLDTADTYYNLLQYYLVGIGPFSTGPTETMAFLDSGVQSNLDFPDLQLHFEGGFWQETDQTVCNISMLRQVFGSVIDDTTQQGFAIQPILLQPKSVGEIYLNITDPYNYM